MLPTGAIIGESDPTGRIPPVECPGALALVAGAPLSAYRTLAPDDELYDDFCLAWRQQGEWDRATHYAYWRAGLRLWPRADGQVRRDKMLGAWVWSWRRCGVSDEAIADRLGRRLDSLRHCGALRYADELARERPWSERRWERAPLIVAVERESPPHLMDAWFDPRLTELLPESVMRLRTEFAALTAQGPPRP